MTREEIIAALSEQHDSAEHVELMAALDALDRVAAVSPTPN